MPSTSPVRIALLGCGRVARLVHLPTLARMAEVRLVAVAEPDPELRAAAARAAPGARSYERYDDAVADAQVEAVVVCLPTDLHAPAAEAAIDAGKHVYLEKPIAITATEAALLISRWQRSGVVGMAGLNYRFHPSYQAGRDALSRGAIGTPVAARTCFASAPRPLPAWQQARSRGGGVLLNLASHHVDLVHWLFDSAVLEVEAALRSQRSEGDSAAVRLRLADGTLVQSLFSMNAVPEDRFEIYGDAGKLTLDRYGSLDLDVAGPRRAATRGHRIRAAAREALRAPRRLRRFLGGSQEPSYRAAFRHFADAIRSGRPPRPDFFDGYRSLAVIEAAERSAATGRSVRLPPDGPDEATSSDHSPAASMPER